MRKTRTLFTLLLVMLMFVSGMAMAESAPVVITDGLNREVEIAAAPERIVSLSPSNTEILFALGVGDKVVGVDSSSDYPAEAIEIEKVGDYSGPNIEAIVAVKPDVIFASTSLQMETIDQLISLGMTVVCNDVTTYDEIASGIQLVADVVGADATAVLADMEAKKEEILANVPATENKPKVYMALSFGEYGDYTAGPGTFIDEMITMAGGVNVAGNAEVSWPMYSLEQLVADDPDVILISDYMGDGSLKELLMSSEGYKDLRCVKEGRVYEIDANTSSRPAPRINEALQEIVEALHGEAAAAE